MVQYDEYGNVIDDERKYPAKAAVAQAKPRDASGRFLSGERLQEYQVQQQAIMQQAERDKVNQLLGRGQSFMQTPGMQSGQSDFAALLAANKPGGRAQVPAEGDKWDILLGKKRRMI